MSPADATPRPAPERVWIAEVFPDGHVDAAVERDATYTVEYVRAASSPAPTRPLGGWQPIATAPKDGTMVLLTDKYNMAVGWWHQATADGITGWYIRGGVFGGAIHWQPLPAPPGSEP